MGGAVDLRLRLRAPLSVLFLLLTAHGSIQQLAGLDTTDIVMTIRNGRAVSPSNFEFGHDLTEG